MGLFDSLGSGLLGAGMGFLTGGPAGALVGGLGGLSSSKKPQTRANANAAAAQQAQGQLTGVGNDLLGRYQQASPMERGILDYFYNRAGLGAGGNAPGGMGAGVGGVGGLFGGHTGAPIGTAPGVNGGQPFAAWGSRKNLPGFSPVQGNAGPLGGALGIYNSPEYQLLRQQAEQDIGHQVQNSQLGFNAELGQRGIDRSSIQQGGQAAITAGGNKSYADFVRNLAIGAADKQDQLAGQALGSLGGALGSGAQAGNLFGQSAGLGFQGQGLNQAQQNTNSSALGNAIGSAANYWALKSQGGGGSPGSIFGDPSGVDQSPGFIPSDTAWKAHGGPVQAGHPYVVGDGGGPEAFVPTGTPAKTEKVSIPSQVLQDLIAHLIARSAVHTITPPPAPMPHRAMGGPVQPGQPYLIGEHGPEMMVPQQPGYIVPNPATQAADAGQHPLVSYLQALTTMKGC